MNIHRKNHIKIKIPKIYRPIKLPSIVWRGLVGKVYYDVVDKYYIAIAHYDYGHPKGCTGLVIGAGMTKIKLRRDFKECVDCWLDYID